MTWKEHINRRKDIYLLLLSWAVVGAFLPRVVAIGYSVVTFLLVLRTKDLTRILIALLAMLIFSDSRSNVFAFAENAKIGAVILTLLFAIFRYSAMPIKRNHIFKFFLPFLLFSVLATFWSSVPFTAFQKSVSYGSIFFIIPLLLLNGREENKWIGQELVYFFALILASGLVMYLFDPSFATLVGRYRGLLGNPNGLGIFLTVVFSVFYPVFASDRPALSAQRFLPIFFGLVFISVIMTGSRTALIAIILFFVFNRVKYLSNTVSLTIFIILIASYEYLLFYLPNLIVSLGLEDFFD